MSMVIFFAAPFAFGAKTPTNTALYFLYLAIFIIASLSMRTVLGVFIKSATKLTMISQFIFLPSIMLTGIMFPINMLPNLLRKAGEIFPATWGFKLMESKVFDVKSLIALGVIIAAAICISGYKLSKMSFE